MRRRLRALTAAYGGSMAHPTTYEAADPYLTRLRTICLALPGAEEKVSHGRPNFFTRKVFAIYGGVVKGDHDPEPYRQALIVQPDESDREALLGDGRLSLLPGRAACSRVDVGGGACVRRDGYHLVLTPGPLPDTEGPTP